MTATDAMQSQNKALRTRLIFLLGAARQYRAAEKQFNAALQATEGVGRAFDRAAAELIAARETFDGIIAPPENEFTDDD